MKTEPWAAAAPQYVNPFSILKLAFYGICNVLVLIGIAVLFITFASAAAAFVAVGGTYECMRHRWMERSKVK